MSEIDATDAAARLRQLAVRAIVERTGLLEAHAQPFADAVIAGLQAEYGGDRLHIPKMRGRATHAARREAIRVDLEAGLTTREVCVRYGVSRTALHRLFPGGLPKATRRCAGD
jgi:hypothetical protein